MPKKINEGQNNRYREEENEESELTKKDINTSDQELKKENEINELSDLAKLKEENKKLNDLYLRTLAETENFKKRINDEKIRDRKYSTQNFLEKIIDPLDIFDKAVNIKTDDEKLKNFLLGFEMINNNLKQVIEEEGVKKMRTVGEIFNPSFHHAVETGWDEGKEEGIILSELQSGYIYKDRILRAAIVKVNKKEINKEENKNE